MKVLIFSVELNHLYTTQKNQKDITLHSFEYIEASYTVDCNSFDAFKLNNNQNIVISAALQLKADKLKLIQKQEGFSSKPHLK